MVVLLVILVFILGTCTFGLGNYSLVRKKELKPESKEPLLTYNSKLPYEGLEFLFTVLVYSIIAILHLYNLLYCLHDNTN